MPRHDREIHGATLGDLADRARASALGDAREQRNPSRVAERSEQFRRKRPVNRRAARGCLFRRAGSSHAYLRHHANIDAPSRRGEMVAKKSPARAGLK